MSASTSGAGTEVPEGLGLNIRVGHAAEIDSANTEIQKFVYSVGMLFLIFKSVYKMRACKKTESIVSLARIY